MAHFPERRKLPFQPGISQNADAAREKARTLTCSRVRGNYVSKHKGGKKVDVFRVTDWFGFEKALLFQTPLNEDLDGAPNSYAPPISATNVSPRDGLNAKENIKNATNERGVVFHDDPKLNTFLWTGIVSSTWGRKGPAAR